MWNGKAGQMALKKSSIFDFREATRKILDDYEVSCYEELSEAIDEVRKESVKRLRSASREQFGNGDYAKGWTSKMEKGRINATAVVYGKKPTYSLAHLLEFGHVTRNGTGRSYDPTPGHPHIEAVNNWAQDEAIDRAVRKLEKRL